MTDKRFVIGLVINPFAGLGGPVALKGSDGAATVEQALSLGAKSQVHNRVVRCLEMIRQDADRFSILTVDGAMGASACDRVGLSYDVIAHTSSDPSTAADTVSAVRQMQERGVDLVLFAGGDGTARDVCDVLDLDQTVLGIPCGVKMHSGVFANNPEAAGRVLDDLINGRLVSVMKGEVRDIDETSFREGVVRTQYYGEVWVPEELRYVQAVKSGGREVEALAVQDIAAQVVENMMPDTTYLIGAGSTTAAMNEALGLENTLLGVDVVRDGKTLHLDADEAQLFEHARAGNCRILVTPIGGQGHILGRGNQQFSPRVLDAVGLENLMILATKTKLEALAGRPLLVDSGSAELDRRLSGTRQVITGYEDSVLYPVGEPA